MELPRSAAQLTKEWLTQALALPTPATEVETRPVSQPGVNGEVVRLRLQCAAAQPEHCCSSSSCSPPAPLRLVAKFPPLDRRVATAMGWSRREVGFYQELAGLSTLAPRVRFSAWNPRSDDSLLLLDELGDEDEDDVGRGGGGRWLQGDQLRGCDAQEAAGAVDALASHHAAFWERPVPDWVPCTTNLAGISSGPSAQ
jgi:hypothetical protein